jgi:hypothetical protein
MGAPKPPGKMLSSLQPRSHFRNGFSGALRALFNGIRTSQENRPFSLSP